MKYGLFPPDTRKRVIKDRFKGDIQVSDVIERSNFFFSVVRHVSSVMI